MIFINASAKDSFKIFGKVAPIYPPFGTAYIMAIFETMKIPFAFVDAILEKDIPARISRECATLRPPYIFGFNVLTISYKSALDLAAHLKSMYSDSIVVFGGVHPTALPEEVLGNSQVDVVVRGEAELIMPRLYHALKNGESLHEIDAISYKHSGKIVHNRNSEKLIELSDLPPFPHHLFTHPRYARGYMMTSRGCPYRCIFCSKISGNTAQRFLPVDKVIEEMEYMLKEHKVKQVVFLDDDMLGNPQRMLTLCDAIRNAGLHKKLVFNFEARADRCNRELLSTIYEAGFKGIFLGMETASESIMKTLKKGESLQTTIEAAHLAKELGFHVSCNFIFGLPGETHHDRKKAFALARELKLDLVKYNNATPFPGTELFEMAKRENRLNIVGQYENFIATATLTENPFRKIPLPYIPAGNTEKQIRYDVLFGSFLFYFSFRKLKRVFTQPELSNSWFDFGHNVNDFFRKLGPVLMLLMLLTIKFGEMLLVYPFIRKKTEKA